MFLQVLLRWSSVVKFADIKVAIDCLVLMMTTPNIQWYLVKSLYLKDNSSDRRCTQYQDVLSTYSFKYDLVHMTKRHTYNVKSSLRSQLFHPTMFKRGLLFQAFQVVWSLNSLMMVIKLKKSQVSSR